MNTNCFQSSEGLNPDILGILRYNNSVGYPNTTSWDDTMDVICQDLNLTELTPAVAPSMPSTSSLSVRLDISFQTGAGELNLGYINSTSWVPLNGTDTLETFNSTVTGLDISGSQQIYSIPTIQTVEYPPPYLKLI